MATFKIGQRVRKVRHPSWPMPHPQTTIPIGAECTVVDFRGSDGADIRVKWSGYPDVIGSQQVCFEPILYDGNQVISWDACIWNPSHIHKQRTTEETSRV